MSGFIEDSAIGEILNRVNIVEVISEYIPLRKAGRNFKAFCPFHHEKTASFLVSSDKQIYHCFGCGAGGNVFNFLMQYERMSFPEALELLAKKTGVILARMPKSAVNTQSIATQIYKINELAAQFYSDNLNSPQGLKARQYLAKRAVRPETIKLFRLGLAPDKWDSFINHLREKSISIALLEKAGLVLPREGGGYYDRFRDRIIFPIFDVKSQIAGFGARIMDAGLPKYINSPETAVYVKGKNLYGLNLAKDAVRENDYIAVVEGYLDCIMPYQQGFKNIVASSGTALTQEQARLIKRHTRNVTVIYDGDPAGQMATLRSLDIFIEEDIDVKVAVLPQGFDPDSYVRKNGIDGFKHLVAESKTLFDYKMQVLRARYSTEKIESKALICAEMLQTVNRFKNAILKSEYLKKLSQELSTSEDALIQELNKLKQVRGSGSDKTESKKTIFVNPTEKLLVKLMLEETRLIHKIKGALSPEDFQDSKVSKLVSTMFELVEKSKSPQTAFLINSLGDENISRLICESTFETAVPEDSDREAIVDDCIMRLKKKSLFLRRKRIHENIRLAESSGDEDSLNKLKQEFNLLIKHKAGEK